MIYKIKFWLLSHSRILRYFHRRKISHINKRLIESGSKVIYSPYVLLTSPTLLGNYNNSENYNAINTKYAKKDVSPLYQNCLKFLID